jgi:hypothetical protein
MGCQMVCELGIRVKYNQTGAQMPHCRCACTRIVGGSVPYPAMQRMRRSTQDGLHRQKAAMVMEAAEEAYPVPAPSAPAAAVMSSRRNVVRLAGALMMVCPTSSIVAMCAGLHDGLLRTEVCVVLAGQHCVTCKCRAGTNEPGSGSSHQPVHPGQVDDVCLQMESAIKP